ncbi:MAG: hypothetical protein M3O50_13265 [Myxococcota bacterium]|nr:hypothetical protein [Myxococcota bacterium]
MHVPHAYNFVAASQGHGFTPMLSGPHALSHVGIAPGVHAVLSFSVLGHMAFAPPSEDALPEEAAPELLLPEPAVPELLLPDAELPEALLPDAELPDALLPEAELPDALLPDGELPDALLVPDVPAPLLPTLPEPPPPDASSELASVVGHVVAVVDEQPTPEATDASEATSAAKKPVFMVPVNVDAERTWLRHSQRDARETAGVRCDIAPAVSGGSKPPGRTKQRCPPIDACASMSGHHHSPRFRRSTARGLRSDCSARSCRP